MGAVSRHGAAAASKNPLRAKKGFRLLPATPLAKLHPMIYRPHIGFLSLLLALPAAVTGADCWSQAGARYGIAPAVLVAISRTESNLDPRAINRNDNGSVDIGLMQINSQWWPALADFGIAPEHLWDPCTSIHVGAWILANNLRRGDFWSAVGAYNAGWRPERENQRRAYAWRVYRHLATR